MRGKKGCLGTKRGAPHRQNCLILLPLQEKKGERGGKTKESSTNVRRQSMTHNGDIRVVLWRNCVDRRREGPMWPAKGLAESRFNTSTIRGPSFAYLVRSPVESKVGGKIGSIFNGDARDCGVDSP